MQWKQVAKMSNSWLVSFKTNISKDRLIKWMEPILRGDILGKFNLNLEFDNKGNFATISDPIDPDNEEKLYFYLNSQHPRTLSISMNLNYHMEWINSFIINELSYLYGGYIGSDCDNEKWKGIHNKCPTYKSYFDSRYAFLKKVNPSSFQFIWDLLPKEIQCL